MFYIDVMDAHSAGYSGERVLKTGQFRVEKKTFILALKENKRGRFLQITETDGHRAKIIVPASGIQEFAWMFDAILKSAEE